jgi:hypothetical protein
VLAIGTTVVVALLVLPPLLTVAVGGTSGGFAPLHHMDIVGNTLLLTFGATAGALLIGGGLTLALARDVPGGPTLERLVTIRCT